MSLALRAVKKEFVAEFRISWRDERLSAYFADLCKSVNGLEGRKGMRNVSETRFAENIARNKFYKVQTNPSHVSKKEKKQISIKFL